MSRITGGVFKGRPLIVPRSVRATEAKVRQALFNILGGVIEGARVIDAFAGSGAIGCEALSRGAAFVAFIDSDGEAVLSIRDNLARFEAELPRSAWRVLHLDVERGVQHLAKEGRPFDVIIFDPPYGSAEGKKALNSVVDCAMLAPSGVAVVEHDRRTSVPASLGFLQQRRQHRYGDTVLSFYQWAA